MYISSCFVRYRIRMLRCALPFSALRKQFIIDRQNRKHDFDFVILNHSKYDFDFNSFFNQEKIMILILILNHFLVDDLDFDFKSF